MRVAWRKFRFNRVGTLLTLLLCATTASGDERDTLPAARTGSDGALFSAPFPGSGARGGTLPAGGGRIDETQRAAMELIPPARGSVTAESLIGKRDTQVRIYAGSAPVRATALITFTVNGKTGYCTGWFYGPNVLATAGHCIHEGNGGSYHENVTVYPAYDAGAMPYGSYAAVNTYAPLQWQADGNDNYDYGLISLDQKVGNTVGYYGVWAKSGSLKGLAAIIAGYPAGKSPDKSLWLSSDVVRVSKSRQIYYKNDTYAGQSGSAVWLDRPVGKGLDDGPYAYAIHTNGTTASPTSSSAYNSATRIDTSVFESMMMFRDMNALP